METKQTKQTETKKVDWLITLLPLDLLWSYVFYSSLSRSNPIRCLVRLDMYLVIHLELIIL